MTGPDVTPGRLEAISDGIFAIVITIMVLELRPPAAPHWRALVSVWPDLLSYLISFAFVATYWVNHRHVIRRLPAFREGIVWMNIVLLFLISLIPFSTAYMGRSGLAPFPMALYAGVLIACGLAFAVLRALIAAEIADLASRRAFNGPKVQAVGALTFVMLLAAAGLSFVSPPVALAVIVASSLLHIAPLTHQRMTLAFLAPLHRRSPGRGERRAGVHLARAGRRRPGRRPRPGQVPRPRRPKEWFGQN